MQSTDPRKQEWEATKIPNLIVLTGRYYGRVKVGGKSVRKSFGNKSFSVAKQRLRDWLISINAVKSLPGGTFGGMIELYRGWLEGQRITGEVGQSTIDYKLELIESIRGTWPGFDHAKLEDLAADRMRTWQVAHRTKYAATRTNGAITALREILALAVTKAVMSQDTCTRALTGLQFTKVAYDYKRMTMQLPEPDKLLVE